MDESRTGPIVWVGRDGLLIGEIIDNWGTSFDLMYAGSLHTVSGVNDYAFVEDIPIPPEGSVYVFDGKTFTLEDVSDGLEYFRRDAYYHAFIIRPSIIDEIALAKLQFRSVIEHSE